MFAFGVPANCNAYEDEHCHCHHQYALVTATQRRKRQNDQTKRAMPNYTATAQTLFRPRPCQRFTAASALAPTYLSSLRDADGARPPTMAAPSVSLTSAIFIRQAAVRSLPQHDGLQQHQKRLKYVPLMRVGPHPRQARQANAHFFCSWNGQPLFFLLTYGTL